MGNRLTKIVTRTGDDGTTGLADGSRVEKCSLRINALGDIDELNCCIGVLISDTVAAEERVLLSAIQQNLFDLGSEIAVPGREFLAVDAVDRLEAAIAGHQTYLAPLREFILPGGSRPAALAHQCRAVCRRAERALVALARAEAGVSALGLQYLNRLSDLMFVLARRLNQNLGVADSCWRGTKK